MKTNLRKKKKVKKEKYFFRMIICSIISAYGKPQKRADVQYIVTKGLRTDFIHEVI